MLTSTTATAGPIGDGPSPSASLAVKIVAGPAVFTGFSKATRSWPFGPTEGLGKSPPSEPETTSVGPNGPTWPGPVTAAPATAIRASRPVKATQTAWGAVVPPLP